MNQKSESVTLQFNAKLDKWVALIPVFVNLNKVRVRLDCEGGTHLRVISKSNRMLEQSRGKPEL